MQGCFKNESEVTAIDLLSHNFQPAINTGPYFLVCNAQAQTGSPVFNVFILFTIYFRPFITSLSLLHMMFISSHAFSCEMKSRKNEALPQINKKDLYCFVLSNGTTAEHTQYRSFIDCTTCQYVFDNNNNNPKMMTIDMYTTLLQVIFIACPDKQQQQKKRVNKSLAISISYLSKNLNLMETQSNTSSE